MFKYKEFIPCAQLTPYIKCYWILESDEQVNVTDRILPDGCIEMLFHFGDQFIKDLQGNPRLVERFFVNGQNTSSFTLSPSGFTCLLGVRFKPYGAWPILHVPVNELTDKFISINDLYGQSGSQFTEQLYNELTWKGRIDLVNEFLTKELQHSKWTIDHIVNNLVTKIYIDKSKLNLTEYASEVKFSERHIRRKFLEVVGINPSLFIRIVRFREIFKLRKENVDSNLLGLALDTGYHDQSHFIRDFKEFSGQTPTMFFNEKHFMGSNFF